MSYQHNTRQGRTFDEWLADCSNWWDMTKGEEAYDYPWLPWLGWYQEGLSVEQAVRRADAQVFGGPVG